MYTRTKSNWRPQLETLEARRLLSVYADFNGDGFGDLAVGAPGENVNGFNSAGAVNVIYGSAGGLTDTNNQFFHQDTPGIDDTVELGDNFGGSLVAGDFNGDGFADLVIGVPSEDIGTVSGAGAFHVLYGSASGLAAGAAFFHQDTPRVREIAEVGDLFSTSLAAGDFNKDGKDDLAVGVPSEDVGAENSAGLVQMFYGTAVGIKPPGNQTFDRNHPLIDGVATAEDSFGLAISAADFNGDGVEDVAIGVPGADIGAANAGGAVTIVYGSANGIGGTGSQWIHQDSADVPDTSESADNFGGAMAAGDFNLDGYADLAVGIIQESVGSIQSAGAFITLYGTDQGITGEGSTLFTEDHIGDKNVSELNDRWGRGLTAGDYNGDGRVDLAVAAAAEDYDGVNDVGAVTVLYGSVAGITIDNYEFMIQESVINGETSELDDEFGFVMSSGDFDGDGDGELAIGTPQETVGAVFDAGAVFVVYGGNVFTNGETWTQDSPGILDAVEGSDRFGGGLVADTKNAPNDRGAGREDFAHLITADVETEPILAKTNKRRNSGRR